MKLPNNGQTYEKFTKKLPNQKIIGKITHKRRVIATTHFFYQRNTNFTQLLLARSHVFAPLQGAGQKKRQ